MGGGGSIEYRKAGGVGPWTICRSWAMEGGRGLLTALRSAVARSTAWTLTLFGFVASFAFSCSSRANNSAVDCGGQFLLSKFKLL